MELIIIDESERLGPTALELIRDRFDRDNIALILIGMPGIEKQFSAMRSYTAESDSPTSTALSQGKSCASFWTAAGTASDRTSTPTTSPTPRPSPQLPASPGVTSGSSTGSSPRWSESCASTN
ncbi:potential ATP-binding protein (plasmid) [Arthrobacter sp. Hiyo8]|nr:potential ATP-binding protein [Arthrobacter sp. Hiyo8]